MSALTRIVLAVALALPAAALQAQRPTYPPDLPGARVEVYRSIDGTDLRAWVFEPAGHGAGDARPAVVFFFGGGWNAGSPGQFAPHAAHLAQQGLIGIVVDYRVRSRHGTLADAAVSDARAAIRWVRAEAARLGVDPDRIAAGGGSAGGHLAAATALLPATDAAGAEGAVRATPDALLLFNPVVITAPYPGQTEQEAQKFGQLANRLGGAPQALSPFHHVRAGLPPTLIFHGEEDTTVPYRHVEAFTAAMIAAGNRCELVGYPGEGHGFFNAHRGDGSVYRDTLAHVDGFLDSLGWLDRP